MHYTLYLHCFNIFIFWYFDRMQTTIYRIVLRQFPLAFVFSLVCCRCRCSIFCLFVHPNSIGFAWRKKTAQTLQMTPTSGLSLVAFFFILFDASFTLNWRGFFQFKVYNSLAICFATQPICTVLSVMMPRQCCRCCCFVLNEFVAFSSSFRQNDFVISILSLSLPRMQCNEERRNEWMNEALLLLGFVLFMFNLFSYCLCVSLSRSLDHCLLLKAIICMWRRNND